MYKKIPKRQAQHSRPRRVSKYPFW